MIAQLSDVAFWTLMILAIPSVTSIVVFTLCVMFHIEEDR
jgi:hypothetical protein